ncbi:hypothetical protein CDAR_386081 [Caerostris darwini]|uniref:Uncharacterized protein n=1 Tax=Caerostris darwini TaxID=1538125 RepID=A0AAV4SKJ3_9ARAC|nr:hypothetical protein CDAR_386081 [Caerostris darwini]
MSNLCREYHISKPTTTKHYNKFFLQSSPITNNPFAIAFSTKYDRENVWPYLSESFSIQKICLSSPITSEWKQFSSRRQLQTRSAFCLFARRDDYDFGFIFSIFIAPFSSFCAR